MGLGEAKNIERSNIPWGLAFETDPNFYVYKIEEEEKNLILSYGVEDRGVSIWFDDHEKFMDFESKIRVYSGGWYIDKGRWAPVERYSGTIICKNVIHFKSISKEGINYSFKTRKLFLSKYKILLVESEDVGIKEIKCEKIIPQEYDILLFDKIKNAWVKRSDVISRIKNNNL